MAVGEVFRCVLKGSYLSKPFINRFYYQQLAGTAGATAMASALEDQLVPALALGVCDNVVFEGVEVLSLGNPTSYVDYAFDPVINGNQLGSPMPSFNAWGFKLVRESRVMRSGAKRIVGVPEDVTVGNDPTTGQRVILDAMAAAMSTELSWGAGNIYTPRLVREGPGEIVEINIGIEAVVFTRLTTQNSRK